MPQRAATIVSLPMAFVVVKAMQGDNLEWGEDYRPLARQAVAEIIEDEMAQAVDRYLDQLSLEDGPDRRNGYYPRHLLTTLGDIELAVPRTRRYSPVSVLRAYARREAEIDRVMLAGFVLGLSTRKVGETLLAIPQDRGGRPQAAGAGGARLAARRQEGGHRLPLGQERKRRRMGTLPHRPLSPRPDR